MILTFFLTDWAATRPSAPRLGPPTETQRLRTSNRPLDACRVQLATTRPFYDALMKEERGPRYISSGQLTCPARV